jgi:TRAP-type C4-dicarboxylate transport system permease small subunit
MRLLRWLQRLADGIERLLKVCVIVSLGCIAAVVNLSVFFRYVLNSSLSWSNELARYLLVFTVVFAAAIALRQQRFVNVEIVRDLLPGTAGRVIGIIARVLICAFLVVCIFSPEAMIEKALRTSTISPAMSLPMAAVYRLMQAGFATMVLFLLFGFVDSALAASGDRRKKEGRS